MLHTRLKRSVILLLFCFGLLASAAENLLKNGDFSTLNEKRQPAEWTCRGNTENFQFTEGKAELKGKNTSLIASLTPAVGKEAVITCRVAGKGKYRIYAEWYWQQDGKKHSRSTGTAWKDAVPEGKDFMLSLQIPGQPETGAVLVLQTDSEEFITFSGLAVKEFDLRNFVLAPKAVQKINMPPLEPGKKYKITYSVRGTGITGNTTCFHFFRMLLSDSRGNRLASFPQEDCMEEFQNKSITFTAPGEGNPVLEIRSQSAGMLEFKDLETKPAADEGPADRLVITSPRFRGTFYSSLEEKAVSGYVVSDSPVSGGTAVLKTASGQSHSAELEQSGGEWKFSLPGEPGQLEITLKSPDGKVRVLTQEIQRLPASSMEVIADSDNMLRINGKPFFPVMFYFYGGGKNLYASARNGLNTIMVAPPARASQLLAVLDGAEEYGMKVFLSFMHSVPSVYNEEKLRAWENMVENLLTKEVLAHPALLGYYLDDEPYWCGVNIRSFKRGYDFLRKIDPYRPVWVCAAPRGTVEEQRPYGQCSDVYGIDIYPVPVPNAHSHLDDKTLSCVGKYALRSGEITDHVKPVLMTIQGYSWNDFRKRNGGELIGYPTREESRFMVYDAIINGSTGLCWYGVSYVRSPDFLDDLLDIARELQKISGVLTSRSSVRGQVSAVEFRLFSGDGWTFAIAANTSDQPIESVLPDIPGASEGNLSFVPYEVKFFRTGPTPPPAWELPPEDKTKEDPILVFTEPIRRRLNSVEYEAPPNMKWIWDEKVKDVKCSEIFARVRFQVEPGLEKACLRYAADDNVSAVFIDGIPLSGFKNFASSSYMAVNDITDPLKAGEHVLCIRANDAGQLPCGLLAEIRLEYGDGRIVSIPTNASWETSTSLSGPWTGAAEIRALGEKPWGTPRLLPAETPPSAK